MTPTPRQPCDWKQDNDGNWDTACKQCLCFDYALPFELGYKFCHHCGLPINFINFIKPLDESLDAGGDGNLHDQMGGIRPRERMGNILG